MHRLACLITVSIVLENGRFSLAVAISRRFLRCFVVVFGGCCDRREHHTPHQVQTEKATPTPKCPVIDARPGSFSKPAIFDGHGSAWKCIFQNILEIRKFRGYEELCVNGVGRGFDENTTSRILKIGSEGVAVVACMCCGGGKRWVEGDDPACFAIPRPRAAFQNRIAGGRHP